MTRSALPNDGGHPLREMEDLLEGYGRALDRLGRMASDLLPKGDSTPRVDITGTYKSFVIKMEIPEVNKKDEKVSVGHGVLSICGERKQEK